MNVERLISVLLLSKCSDEEILAFVPLLLRSAKVKLEPATSAALFTRIGELVGAKASDTDAALQKKLADYYQAHPPPRALQKAFTQFVERESGRATADGFDFGVQAKEKR